MRAQLLTTTLRCLFEINRPVHIEGPPGLGKTQLTEQVAREMYGDAGFIHIHAPLMQPEDAGMPVVNRDASGKASVEFVVPERKFPIVGSDVTPDEGVLLYDELSQCDPSQQKILANTIQAREIHGFKLKPGWRIASTGNRSTDRSGVVRILAHLRNRMTTLEFEPHAEDWATWAYAHDVRPEVITFVSKVRPNLLSNFDPKLEISPTPRGWAEGVSPILDRVPAEAEYECFKGAVGEGAAAEFRGFLKVFRELPDPQVILSRPESAFVPDSSKPDVLYAICGAVVHFVTPETMAALITYGRRLPGEYMIMMIQDAVRRNPLNANTPAFKQFVASPEGRAALGIGNA